MYFINPLLKLMRAQLTVAMKYYGTDCMKFTKLISEQDKVYGNFSGADSVMTTQKGNADDVYGDASSKPSDISSGLVSLDNNFNNSTIDLSSGYSPPTPVRVLLPRSQWRISGGLSSYYNDWNGNAWVLNPDSDIINGDILVISVSDSSRILLKVIEPEILGKEDSYLMRFSISNVGEV